MVVVMLLSGIVITISFKSFDILSKSYLDFKNSQQALADLATLDRLLVLDFMRSGEVRKTDRGFKAIFKNSEINYLVDPDYLIRKQATRTDTFRLYMQALEVKFKHVAVPEPGRLLDEISFQNLYRKEVQQFHYRKNYGTDKLMEEEAKMLTSN